MATDDGVTTERLPGVRVGAFGSTAVDGGVNTGVVSDSGAVADGVGSGTTVAAGRNKNTFNIKF